MDMWSVGCIMAELINRDALFMGKDEVHQLHRILQALGRPTEESWPGHTQLRYSWTVSPHAAILTCSIGY